MTAAALLDNAELLFETPTTTTGVHDFQPANLGIVTIHIHSHSQHQIVPERWAVLTGWLP